MPLWTPPQLGFTRDMEVGVANRDGIVITANGTADTKGTTYTTLIASTTRDAYGVWLRCTIAAASAAASGICLDIGIGAASSEYDLIPNIQCGWADDIRARGSNEYFFPMFIPAGSRVSARSMGTVASDPVTMFIALEESALYGAAFARCLDYGRSASKGTSVTPASGAFGSWTSIGGTTSRDHSAFLCALDGLADTTLSAEDYILELGVASGDVIGSWQFWSDSTERITGPWPPTPAYHPVPSGTQLQARLAGGSVEARGVIIYAMD